MEDKQEEVVKLERHQNAKGEVYYAWEIKLNIKDDTIIERLKKLDNDLKSEWGKK